MVQVHAAAGAQSRRNGGGTVAGGGMMDFGTGGGGNLLGQGVQKGFPAFHTVGLADKVHRPGRQCVEDPQVQGRHQDNRQRMGWQQLLEEVDAVGPRHFDVQGHDIRLELLDFIQSVVGVDGVAHDLQIGAAGEAAHNHGPGNGGVIHHQYPNFVLRGIHIPFLFPSRILTFCDIRTEPPSGTGDFGSGTPSG